MNNQDNTSQQEDRNWCTEGGEEVEKMVKSLWKEEEFECAWVSGKGGNGSGSIRFNLLIGGEV